MKFLPRHRARPIAERFAAMVQKTEGCWLWTGSVSGGWYGQIQSGPRGGRPLLAHRLSYELHVGPIPDGLYVLHRCDNGLCVNPDHLFLGTHDDNMHDRDTKNRVAHGERHCNARLTEDQVKSIRRRSAAGDSDETIAKEFGISTWNVRHIVKRETWKRVAS